MSADFVESKPLQKYPLKSGRDILDAQYKNGLGVIERADWARSAFESLRRRCPHVPEEQLVRLFHDRSQSQLELIQGSATFAEFNAAHPLGRRKTKPKARAVPKAAPPAAVAKAPKPAPKPVAKKAAAKAPKPKARAAPRPASRKAAPKAKAKRR